MHNCVQSTFCFLIQVTWLPTKFIRNIVIFVWESLTLYAVNYSLLHKRTDIIKKSRITLLFKWSSKLYCRIWKKAKFCCITYSGNLAWLHLEVGLTFEHAMLNVIWYTHWKKVPENISFYIKGHSPSLVFDPVYRATNWIWKRITIFQSVLNIMSRLPGLPDK